MTEREKMMNGEWYDANFDRELLAERMRAEQLCYDFNSSRPGSREQSEALESILGKKPEEGISVLAPVYFDYGINTSLGAGTFVNHGCYFMDGAKIIVGKNVFIGPFCGFYTASHPLRYKERNKGLEKASPIRIGDNCWIGAGVSILPGVTIGNGCVIAAGAVVTRDVPAGTLVGGVPAKKIREIQNEL